MADLVGWVSLRLTQPNHYLRWVSLSLNPTTNLLSLLLLKKIGITINQINMNNTPMYSVERKMFVPIVLLLSNYVGKAIALLVAQDVGLDNVIEGTTSIIKLTQMRQNQ